MIRLTIGAFTFEWDPSKSAENLIKHGVGFELAATIWKHPERVLDIRDERFDYGEDRWFALGPLPDDQRVVVTVAYTDRNENIRIISARFAEKAEERVYRRRFRKA